MTSDPHIRTATESMTEPSRPHSLRLRLKPKAPRTGYVDGGWWPRSRDLVAELPELAEILTGAGALVSEPRSTSDDAKARWQAEGGRVYERA